MGRRARPGALLLLVVGVLLLPGCSTLSFYAQAVSGQLELLAARRDVGALLDQPDTPDALVEKLRLVNAARRFATEQLALPVGDAYSSYVVLDRPHVVTAVVAAPRFSVEPRQWCYPLVGCLSYRGYFRAADARAEARRLEAEGNDVQLSPVAAYSTLGWFADPLTSQMLAYDAPDLVALLFHELAHRRLYLAGDTELNEAYAVAVEELALEAFSAARPGLLEEAALDRYRQRRALRREANALLLEARADLAAIYAREREPARLAALKRERFAMLTRSLDARAAGAPRHAALNNASLALVATYHLLLPCLRASLASYREWSEAHAAVAALGALEPAERRRVLAKRTGLRCGS